MEIRETMLPLLKVPDHPDSRVRRHTLDLLRPGSLASLGELYGNQFKRDGVVLVGEALLIEMTRDNKVCVCCEEEIIDGYVSLVCKIVL